MSTNTSNSDFASAPTDHDENSFEDIVVAEDLFDGETVVLNESPSLALTRVPDNRTARFDRYQPEDARQRADAYSRSVATSRTPRAVPKRTDRTV